MVFEPNEMNVVVMGSWNTAILTPKGVVEKLFKKEEEFSAEVQVPLEREAPIRIKYNDIIVIPSNTSLLLLPVAPKIEKLEEAAQACLNAMNALPHTPFHAVGINIRYKFESTPKSLSDIIRSTADNLLTDADYIIKESTIKRAIKYEIGVVNLELSEDMDSSHSKIQFNFHCSSQVENMKKWLEYSKKFYFLSKSIIDTILKGGTENESI
ncbi:MAG: hypothetical protein ABIH86_02250 [Planctomycetota bacterium]